MIPPPPAIETPTLLCPVDVRRDRATVKCGYVARRYAISKHGRTFSDQYRCARHATQLRKLGYAVAVAKEKRKA